MKFYEKNVEHIRNLVKSNTNRTWLICCLYSPRRGGAGGAGVAGRGERGAGDIGWAGRAERGVQVGHRAQNRTKQYDLHHNRSGYIKQYKTNVFTTFQHFFSASIRPGGTAQFPGR